MLLTPYSSLPPSLPPISDGLSIGKAYCSSALRLLKGLPLHNSCIGYGLTPYPAGNMQVPGTARRSQGLHSLQGGQRVRHVYQRLDAGRKRDRRKMKRREKSLSIPKSKKLLLSQVILYLIIFCVGFQSFAPRQKNAVNGLL